ncbi:hypothetical protein ABE488_00940 [Luteimonas sp. TWI662]|uniref:hypothetical protein n=1 Tax=Luteimonas sp. TWI662 TaxID=3136789 RepID=UPI0032087069
MELPLSTIVEGRVWNLHTLDFKTAEGRFSTYFYAISDEHAVAIVEEIKETASWGGQVLAFMRADGEGRDHG